MGNVNKARVQELCSQNAHFSSLVDMFTNKNKLPDNILNRKTLNPEFYITIALFSEHSLQCLSFHNINTSTQPKLIKYILQIVLHNYLHICN